MTISNEASTPSNAKTAKLATVLDALDMKTTVLIGIVGQTGTPSALLRNPDGSIVKIGRGDKTSAGTVVGINANSVSLQKSGKVRVLRLPQS